MARVMVGIMTRNRPDYVRETVRSVLDQSFDDIRVVVSENPSDPAVAVANAQWVAQQNDARLSYHLQPLDGGEYGQGRFLFSECQEDYLCIIHDDDLMEPSYLEYAIKVLDADPELAFLSASQYLIDANGKEQPQLTAEYCAYQARDKFPEGRMENPLEPLLEHGLFSISGVVMRRQPVAEYGLVDADIGGIYPFEFNVFLRLTEQGLPAWYTPKRLIAYRWHDTSMRQSDGSILTRYMVETLVELLKRRRFSGRAEMLRRRLLAYNLRNLGYIELVAGEKDAALRTLCDAVARYPRGLGLWFYLFRACVAPGYIKKTWGPRVNLQAPAPDWARAIPTPTVMGVKPLA